MGDRGISQRAQTNLWFEMLPGLNKSGTKKSYSTYLYQASRPTKVEQYILLSTTVEYYNWIHCISDEN